MLRLLMKVGGGGAAPGTVEQLAAQLKATSWRTNVMKVSG